MPKLDRLTDRIKTHYHQEGDMGWEETMIRAEISMSDIPYYDVPNEDNLRYATKISMAVEYFIYAGTLLGEDVVQMIYDRLEDE